MSEPVVIETQHPLTEPTTGEQLVEFTDCDYVEIYTDPNCEVQCLDLIGITDADGNWLFPTLSCSFGGERYFTREKTLRLIWDLYGTNYWGFKITFYPRTGRMPLGGCSDLHVEHTYMLSHKGWHPGGSRGVGPHVFGDKLVVIAQTLPDQNRRANLEALSWTQGQENWTRLGSTGPTIHAPFYVCSRMGDHIYVGYWVRQDSSYLWRLASFEPRSGEWSNVISLDSNLCAESIVVTPDGRCFAACNGRVTMVSESGGQTVYDSDFDGLSDSFLCLAQQGSSWLLHYIFVDSDMSGWWGSSTVYHVIIDPDLNVYGPFTVAYNGTSFRTWISSVGYDQGKLHVVLWYPQIINNSEYVYLIYGHTDAWNTSDVIWNTEMASDGAPFYTALVFDGSDKPRIICAPYPGYGPPGDTRILVQIRFTGSQWVSEALVSEVDASRAEMMLDRACYAHTIHGAIYWPSSSIGCVVLFSYGNIDEAADYLMNWRCSSYGICYRWGWLWSVGLEGMSAGDIIREGQEEPPPPPSEERPPEPVEPDPQGERDDLPPDPSQQECMPSIEISSADYFDLCLDWSDWLEGEEIQISFWTLVAAGIEPVEMRAKWTGTVTYIPVSDMLRYVPASCRMLYLRNKVTTNLGRVEVRTVRVDIKRPSWVGPEPTGYVKHGITT